VHPKIVALDVSPVERGWLEDQLDELERLVEEGDTLELVGRLAAVVREPQRIDQSVGVQEGAGAASAAPAPSERV